MTPFARRDTVTRPLLQANDLRKLLSDADARLFPRLCRARTFFEKQHTTVHAACRTLMSARQKRPTGAWAVEGTTRAV